MEMLNKYPNAASVEEALDKGLAAYSQSEHNETDISSVSTKVESYIKEQVTNIVASSTIDFVNDSKIVNANNGELTDKSGTSTSDFIDLDNAVVYRIEASSKKTLASFAFYDKDMVFISGQTTTSSYETTDYNGKVVFNYGKVKPQNAKYIRISKQNSITSVSYHVDVTEDYYIFNGVADNNNSQKAIVTFIDDDFRNDSLVNWEEIADATGIKPVFAVRTNRVGLTQDAPAWDDIDRTRNKGFEYVSHTHEHIYLDEETDETIITDFQATIAALKSHNCTSDVLVYPGGRINAHVKELTKRYFKCGVTVGLKLQTPPLDDYQINRVSFVADERETITVDGTDYSVYRVLSLDELKAIVDDAIDRGGWLIFMSHFRNTLTDGYYFNDTIKERVIELIKYVGSKNIPIVTFSEGYEKMKNIVSCGTLSDETHYIVDCNGQMYQ